MIRLAEWTAALGIDQDPILGEIPDLPAEDARLLAIVTTMITDYLNGSTTSTDDVETEAAIRIAAYMRTTPGDVGTLRRYKLGSQQDMHFAPGAPGNPLRRSGAMALLSPYRKRG